MKQMKVLKHQIKENRNIKSEIKKIKTEKIGFEYSIKVKPVNRKTNVNWNHS